MGRLGHKDADRGQLGRSAQRPGMSEQASGKRIELPPFILVFTAPILVAGIPLIVIYVFGLWAVVIFAAWMVARRHAQAADASAQADSAEAPPGPDAD